MRVAAMVTLAFDVGKTKCRAALFEGDRRVAETERPAGGALADVGGVLCASVPCGVPVGSGSSPPGKDAESALEDGCGC